MESEPRWLRNFYLFEMRKNKAALLKQLCARQPLANKARRESKRHYEVVHGDFNQNISAFLKANPIREKEATFCLLDQRTFECNWSTVALIAGHKKSGNKIELFYFFPEGWLNRSVKAIKHARQDRMRTWWGHDDWGCLLEVHGAERAELVCDRFRTDLGYREVYPFAIYERKSGGRIMYYMIHASDHSEAPKLMNRAYGKALDIKETAEQLDFLRGPGVASCSLARGTETGAGVDSRKCSERDDKGRAFL